VLVAQAVVGSSPVARRREVRRKDEEPVDEWVPEDAMRIERS
jgi:hypothetical protein